MTDLLHSVQKDIFYLAPMHGITLRDWRNVMSKYFPMPDLAVSPFIATFAGSRIKQKLLEDVDPSCEQRIPVIPQTLGKNPEELRVLLRALKALGYERADLNAGCPWPMVTKKGRGAGLLRTPDVLRSLLDVGCEEMPNEFSIKLRLGFAEPNELPALLPILNEYPLREITIHARTAKQMYEGDVHLDALDAALPLCSRPVVYNGDIFTLEDFQRLRSRFPSISRWMIGRGLLRDPFLMADLRAGTRQPRERARLIAFLDDYLSLCEEKLYGPSAVLGRMKEEWNYLSAFFPHPEEVWKSIRICRTLEEYRCIIGTLFVNKKKETIS